MPTAEVFATRWKIQLSDSPTTSYQWTDKPPALAAEVLPGSREPYLVVYVLPAPLECVVKPYPRVGLDCINLIAYIARRTGVSVCPGVPSTFVNAVVYGSVTLPSVNINAQTALRNSAVTGPSASVSAHMLTSWDNTKSCGNFALNNRKKQAPLQ
jgi:hypothetical protein